MEILIEEEPLFTPDETSTTHFLDVIPPERKMLLTSQEIDIPQGVGAIISGQGGVGKSMMALNLAIATASHCPIDAFESVEPMRVLYLSGEDDKDEMHRRTRSILIKHFRRDTGIDFEYDLDHINPILNFLNIPDLTGKPLRLTEKGHDIIETPVFTQLMLAVEPFEQLGLIVVDTAIRFRGGSENDSSDTSLFISLCERLAKKTGATVLVVTHTNKQAAGQNNQNTIRGSSALVDNARLVLSMRQMTEKEADQNEVPSPENYVCLQCVKSNYTKLGKPMWFKKDDFGQFVFTDLQSKMQEKIAFDLDKNKRKILDTLKDEAAQNHFYSKTDFARIFGDKDGVLGLSVGSITKLLQQMIKAEELSIKTDGRKKQLHIKHGI